MVVLDHAGLRMEVVASTDRRVDRLRVFPPQIETRRSAFIVKRCHRPTMRNRNAVHSFRSERHSIEIRICSHSGPAERRQKHAAERADRREGGHCHGQAADHAQPHCRVVEVPARKRVHPAAQIVFVDTPGVHKPGSQLDRRMLQEVHEALETRDVVLVLVDASRRVQLETVGEWERQPQIPQARAGSRRSKTQLAARRQAMGDSAIRMQNREVRVGPAKRSFCSGLFAELDCPVFLVLTKIDLVAKDKLLPLIEALTQAYDFAEVIPVSARKRDGLDVLVRKIVDALPTGERYYPKDQYTDQPHALHGGGADPRADPGGDRRRGSLRVGGGD